MSKDHIQFIISLADNALILGHRNSEWTGHGPILEQDIAISNIALDLVGQARNLYQHAATLIDAAPAELTQTLFHEGALTSVTASATVAPGSREAERSPITEDHLAYLRDSWDYRNCLLVEQPNGDWAQTTLRQFLFSNYQYQAYLQLTASKDSQLAAIAEKSLKEVAYHLRWSSEWVIRLGDGTEESHRRLENALRTLWKFTGELFIPAPYETALDQRTIHQQWLEKIHNIFTKATISTPEEILSPVKGGKEGRHTEHLGYILAEMQFLQRAYPGCEW